MCSLKQNECHQRKYIIMLHFTFEKDVDQRFKLVATLLAHEKKLLNVADFLQIIAKGMPASGGHVIHTREMQAI